MSRDSSDAETVQTEPCPRCLREVPKDGLEPVKYPDMTLLFCGECAEDERRDPTGAEVCQVE